MAPQQRAARWILLPIAFVTLTSCVLVLPPLSSDEHCGFESTSACAACLREHCQSPIDACCDDLVCAGISGSASSTMKGVDACGRGDTAECARAMGSKVLYGAESAVASCVVASCKDACVGDAKVSTKWSCTAPRAREGACATCIYDACTPSLDACCDDASCRSNSDLPTFMGDCTSGDGPACLYHVAPDKVGGAGTTGGTRGALEGCVVEKCGEACLPADNRMHSACTLGDRGKSCSCRVAASSSGVACSTAAVGGSCVIGAKGCCCGQYDCSDTTLGCSCSFKGSSAGTSCRAAEDSDRCCLELTDTGVTCSCGSSRCYGDQVGISNCDEETVASILEGAGRSTDTCSN